jgi:hypothetical protein
MIPETILDLDISGILNNVEKRYHLRLPRKVIALDYGTNGDLYIRFEHVNDPIGEPTEDGLVVLFYKGDSEEVVAAEIMDVIQLT